MSTRNMASRAYAAAAANRTIREQEADVFRLVVTRLQIARLAGQMDRVRALADNRRLWCAIEDQLRDPGNKLPPETRAGIRSIGYSVRREMDLEEPNFDFLITINKQLADGLSGNP
jgi:flagellar biosynthesis regulator FlaF